MSPPRLLVGFVTAIKHRATGNAVKKQCARCVVKDYANAMPKIKYEDRQGSPPDDIRHQRDY